MFSKHVYILYYVFYAKNQNIYNKKSKMRVTSRAYKVRFGIRKGFYSVFVDFRRVHFDNSNFLFFKTHQTINYVNRYFHWMSIHILRDGSRNKA